MFTVNEAFVAVRQNDDSAGLRKISVGSLVAAFPVTHIANAVASNNARSKFRPFMCLVRILIVSFYCRKADTPTILLEVYQNSLAYSIPFSTTRFPFQTKRMKAFCLNVCGRTNHFAASILAIRPFAQTIVSSTEGMTDDPSRKVS